MSQSMVKTLSFGVSGVNGFPVQVEVFCTEGMPMMEIIGLPDTSVRESKNRITAAILSSGVKLPNAIRVTFNLAPADIRKEGASFDLPMAVGLMMVSEELIPRDGFDPENTAFFGELGLDGCIRRVDGVLPMVISAKENGIREVILPAGNAHEAASIEGLRIIPVSHLGEVIRYVNGGYHTAGADPLRAAETGGCLRCGHGPDPRAVSCAPGPGGYRCRRPQHDHDRCSRQRKNHAGQMCSGHPSSDDI